MSSIAVQWFCESVDHSCLTDLLPQAAFCAVFFNLSAITQKNCLQMLAFQQKRPNGWAASGDWNRCVQATVPTSPPSAGENKSHLIDYSAKQTGFFFTPKVHTRLEQRGLCRQRVRLEKKILILPGNYQHMHAYDICVGNAMLFFICRK